MGSVFVHWRGSCSDFIIQKEMISNLVEIGAEFEKYFTNGISTVQYNEFIEGNIILDSSLFKLPKDTNSNYVSTIVKTNELFRLNKVRLHGIEFRVYDPRELYADDRISFVFASSDELSALNGKLVIVENSEECKLYRNPQIVSADYYLTNPLIHLRYLYEKWIDLLLSYIKYYYLNDLHFSRYDELSNYDFWKRDFERIPTDKGKLYFLKLIISKISKEIEDFLANAE